MKSYREHVAEQMAASSSAPKSGVMDESLAGRYLLAAKEFEIRAAKDFWTKLQGAAGDEQRLAMIVKERRGSAIDLLLTQLTSAVAFQMGRILAATVPAPIAALPGFGGFLAALLAKLPYGARAGIQTVSNAYGYGVAMELQKRGG